MGKAFRTAYKPSRRTKTTKCVVWCVLGPEGLVEASHDKSLLPELCTGEKVVKVHFVVE